MSEWTDKLQPASYRDVGFAVLGTDSHFGRRTAVHEYPYRDVVWPEDTGRQPRHFNLVGFLVDDDINRLFQRRDKLIFQAEQPGPGTLIHPTLGRLEVSQTSPVSIVERWDRGRYFEISFQFIEAGERVFPDVQVSGAAVRDASDAGEQAIAAAYARRMNPPTQVGLFGTVLQPLTLGLAAITAQVATVVEYTGMVRAFVVDATCLYNSVKQLPGNFGRYFRAQALGVRTAIGTVVPAPELSIADLVAQGALARQNVTSACVGLGAATTGLTAATVDGVPAAASGVCSAVIVSITNPADAIRILQQLANFYPPTEDSAAPIGQAIQTAISAGGDLLRREALVALGRVSVQYQPFSQDDAISVRDAICSLLDAESLYAADNAEDDTYSAFRALRAAVAGDLTSRGENLPLMKTFQFKANMPALTLAHRIYRDYTRADELVWETDAPHPAFLQATFRALAS